MRRVVTARLADPALEKVRFELTAAVNQLQTSPFAAMRIIRDVSLADGIETPVAHGLGRPAIWVRESCPRGPTTAGMVEEVRTGSGDRSKFVMLRATGWGGTIVCDVAVL